VKKVHRVIAMGMTSLLIFFFLSANVFADANYQINISNNTEYAVFTLAYSGAVTGFQVTSPAGTTYNQNNGAAYKASDGKIQIGIRYAESGRWKILVSGSPDDGFQIVVTSNSSYGDFAGSMPAATPTPIPTEAPTPVPQSTSTPVPVQTAPTATTTVETAVATKTTTASSTKASTATTKVVAAATSPTIATPTATKDPTQTTAVITEVTSTPTSSPHPSETASAAITASPTTVTTPTGNASIKNKMDFSFVSSKVFRSFFTIMLVVIAIAIGCLVVFLVIAKRRNQIRSKYYEASIRRSDKRQQKKAVQKKKASDAALLKQKYQVDAAIATAQEIKIKGEAEAIRAEKNREKEAVTTLLKERRQDEAEAARLHAQQVKTISATMRIQREQEKSAEKIILNKQRQEEITAKLHARQAKVTSATAPIQKTLDEIKTVPVRKEQKRKHRRKKQIRESKYFVYQLKSIPENHHLRYQSYDQLEDLPQINSYTMVFFSSLHWSLNVEAVFQKLHQDDELQGKATISASDILVLERNDACSAYYIDHFGFISCPEFATQHMIQYDDKED